MSIALEQQTKSQATIITEVRVGDKFSGLGEPYNAVSVLKLRGINVIGLFRSGVKFARNSQSVVTARDLWIIRTSASELATLAAVITASAFGWVSLPIAAIIGVGVLLALKSLESSGAWAALNAEVLILVYGMLVVYSLTSVLTEMVTNNAVAVVMTPLAIKLADQLGTDPTALIVAVMFGASASFATPVGYQTNTLVHVAGNYRFCGIPENRRAHEHYCRTDELYRH